MTNPYCDALRIAVPSIEQVKDHPEANTYSLLIIALLERGGPMTLAEVAERFATAGVAPLERAMRALQRCKPARAPIYRDGDEYALDPHDDEADLWTFRLGLRPPRVPALTVARLLTSTRRGLEEPLTVPELDEAWRDANLYSWSAQRLALAVLDARGEAMSPQDVVAFVDARARYHLLRPDSAKFRRSRSAVRVGDDGRWEIGDDREALLAARREVVDRLEMARRWAAARPDPIVMEATRNAYERQRAANADRLARMTRVLIRAFPAKAPQAVALLDIGAHDVRTYLAGEIQEARDCIAAHDIVGAVEVRPLLRALGVDPGARRLAELGPPQKSRTLNKRGRTLRITTSMLIQGSCGMACPLGEDRKLETYLRESRTAPLRRRLEADAKALFHYYQYGRLHGAVRLRWGFLDEMVPAPWVHRDEPGLDHLKRQAFDLGQSLDVVVGGAPGWAEPWARRERCSVERDPGGYGLALIDERGFEIDDRDVQLARLAVGDDTTGVP
ncbi:MAG TPA: hypothetical protein VFV75_08755 [Candidatus Polarisedimenticolaceae bacterium]|nr:hypothetical protein [Candidatus Polarisedimenticolaceae bacterium]